jgi:ribosome-associated protein
MAAHRTPRGRLIPDEAVHVSFSRSGGPGGQHVNTSATRVQVSIDVSLCALPEREEARLRARYGDHVRATASDSRSQWRNRSQALARALELIDAAIAVERPRVATRATRASKERRLTAKAHRARKLENRRRGFDD